MERDTLKKLLLIATGISTLYIVISYGLTITELHFREWVKALGIICTGIVIPFLGLLLIRQNIYTRHEITKTKEIIMHIMALVGFAVWGFFVFLYFIFHVDEDKRLTKSLMVSNEAEFLQENVIAYYEPVGFFFKKRCGRTQEKNREYLEEKYGKEVLERYRGLNIFVYFESFDRGLGDNLVDEVFRMYMIQALEDLDIDRNYYIKDLEYAGKKDLYLELKGEEDIVAFSKDVTDIFTYIDSRTDFFKKYRDVLYFYSGEEENGITGYLPFGNLSTYDNLSNSYFEDPIKMEALVLEKYLVGVVNLEDRLAYEKEMAEILLNVQNQAKEEQFKNKESLKDENFKGNSKDEIVENQMGNEGEILLEENVTGEVTQNQGYFQEEAARRVYEEYLEAEGYAFEVKYNAKGNLYIDLEYRLAGEPQDKSKTGFYGHKLVYDRSSKNGKCEIFVLQRSHYTEGRMEESTVIVDMYAVETTTGQVVVADKQNWGDSGMEEYREITGE